MIFFLMNKLSPIKNNTFYFIINILSSPKILSLFLTLISSIFFFYISDHFHIHSIQSLEEVQTHILFKRLFLVMSINGVFYIICEDCTWGEFLLGLFFNFLLICTIVGAIKSAPSLVVTYIELNNYGYKFEDSSLNSFLIYESYVNDLSLVITFYLGFLYSSLVNSISREIGEIIKDNREEKIKIKTAAVEEF